MFEVSFTPSEEGDEKLQIDYDVADDFFAFTEEDGTCVCVGWETLRDILAATAPLREGV